MRQRFFLSLLGLFVLLVLVLHQYKEQTQEPQEGLNQYPALFLKGKVFDAIIVVSDDGPEEDFIAAQDFLATLQKKYTLQDDTLVQYSHIGGLYDKKTIFIGTCNTRPPNKFVNLFMDCLSMEPNVGMLRLVEKDAIAIIQVVGYDFKDTAEALSVLSNAEAYDLGGTEIQVRGDAPDLTIRITGK